MCVGVCVCVCMRVCVCAGECECVCMYACTHIHVYVYSRTYEQAAILWTSGSTASAHRCPVGLKIIIGREQRDIGEKVEQGLN